MIRLSACPGALIGLGLVLAACHAKESAFNERIFTCDSNESCGTHEGKPMVCYQASQLGAENFCADSCDPNGPEVQDGFACLSSGARFRICYPFAARHDPGFGCPKGLSCLRTDVSKDEGLCMAVRLCSEDSDCQLPRDRCAATVIRETFSSAPVLTDGLFCLHAQCGAQMSACQPDEVCLSSVVDTVATPDICVPRCDPGLNCPPNFVCMRKVYGPQAADACVPGVQGARCMRDYDCLLGSCLQTGAGFKMCSIPCQTHADCRPLNTLTDTFVCASKPEGRYCARVNDFNGIDCPQSEVCPLDQRCFHYNAYEAVDIRECRLPCGADGRCPARGGVPHICLAGGEGGCYPGRFGLPCASSDECIADFVCAGAGPHTAFDGGAGSDICTMPCASDADCDANSWTAQAGHCQSGYCRLGAAFGDPCQRDAECRTRRCGPPGGPAAGTCLERP